MSWRDEAAPVIARVLAETAGKTEAEIRKAIFDAYPFGPREYHPYKIWCDEVAKQRGKKPRTKQKRKPRPGDAEQAELFAAAMAGRGRRP